MQGVLSEVVSPVLSYFTGLPFSALQEISGAKGNPKSIESFLRKVFGDTFTPREMQLIAALLWLPTSTTDWKNWKAQFEVLPGRLELLAPKLSRPCHYLTSGGNEIQNAKTEFEQLWKKATPLQQMPELQEEETNDEDDSRSA